LGTRRAESSRHASGGPSAVAEGDRERAEVEKIKRLHGAK
jgi:hypothetical protein